MFLYVSNLLEFDSSACCFQLSLELFSLSLGCAFLESLGSSLNSFLSFLEGETASVLDSLDNVHLSIAEGYENNIKFSLLSLSGSCACRACCCYYCCNAEFLLDSVNEFCEFENGESLYLFDHSCDLFRCHVNYSFSDSLRCYAAFSVQLTLLRSPSCP